MSDKKERSAQMITNHHRDISTQLSRSTPLTILFRKLHFFLFYLSSIFFFFYIFSFVIFLLVSQVIMQFMSSIFFMQNVLVKDTWQGSILPSLEDNHHLSIDLINNNAVCRTALALHRPLLPLNTQPLNSGHASPTI